MAEIASKPYWELIFDQEGTLTSGTPDAVAEQIAAAGVDNLFVLSHGWGTQRGQAEQLYQQMFPLLSAAADQRPQLGSVGFAGIIWPSIWFPDQPGAPTTATAVGTQSVSAATAGAVNTQAAMTGTQIASALTESFDPDQEAVITEMGRLIDQGQKAVALGAATPQQQEQNVAAFHALLQQITAGAVDAQEDAGETALFDTEDPVSAYQTLAVAMGSATSGGDQQSIGDLFTNVWNGAKDALRVASFWQMKARAGTVGRRGLGPLLELVHNKNPAVRVNVIGHSFGARLVSFALAGISAETKSPVTSLVLIQGAFSHWCFASQQDMPFGQPGALNGYGNRVHGPLVSTFSGYDWAVGTWYPKAAFLAGDFVQAVTVNKWGGMGSDGFQASQPQVDLHIDAAGTTYPMINNAIARTATVSSPTPVNQLSPAHTRTSSTPKSPGSPPMQLHPTPHQASRDGSGLYRIRRMHKPTTLQLSTKTGEMESHRIAAAADNDLYQDSYRATQGSSDSENETRTLLSEWYIPSLWPVQRTLDQPHLTGESLTTRLHDW